MSARLSDAGVKGPARRGGTRLRLVRVAALALLSLSALLASAQELAPIPPLDGSHVFAYLLPTRLAYRYRQIGMAGTAIVFVLLFLGGFRFLWIPVSWLMKFAIGITSVLA